MSFLDILRRVRSDTRTEKMLGNPLRDPLAIERRQSYFATLTNNRGFRVPKKPVATDFQGRTRGQRKRAAHAVAVAKMQEGPL